MISDESDHLQMPFTKCDPKCDENVDCICKCCPHVPNALKSLKEPFIFILELGTQEGKLLFPTQKLIQYLNQKVVDNRGLLVCNEITSGIGRTSEWFAFEHYNLKPDIFALGKGLGNGFPISAVLMAQRIYDDPKLSSFKYAQSHQNDPLGASIASTVIDIINQDHLITKSKEISAYFIGRLTQLLHSYDSFVEVRGKGLMLGLVCSDSKIAIDLQRHLLGENIFVGCVTARGIVRFFPPMTITKHEIDILIDKIHLFFTFPKSDL